MDATTFARNLGHLKLSALERAAAILWFLEDIEGKPVASMGEIVDAVEGAGYGQQNKTRLAQQFARDRRITGNTSAGFRIHASRLDEFRALYEGLAGTKPAPIVNTVLPLEMLSAARGYIKKVAVQLNAAYEYSLFDCCAVMVRRLLETLIIESYERAGSADDLKAGDGNYMMLSGLLGQIEKDPSVLGLSRNAKRGLNDFKRLGDLAAHNRKFNAVQDDIDRVRDGLRVTIEELLYCAGQHASDGATA